MPERSKDCLNVTNLVTGYGKREIVKSASIRVPPGKVVALIGHNGAGKTTILKAIFGLIPIWSGRVTVGGKLLEPLKPRNLLQQGVAYLPQGNRVFSDLTVGENLAVGAFTLQNRVLFNEGIERALSLFPDLKSRLRQRAGTLSGGEQQMLALSSAVILSPRLLLLDEPSLGLAPRLVYQALKRIKDISVNSGTAILIVEQKVREVLKVADYVYVLRNGQVSFSGSADELFDETKLRDVYL